MLLNTIYQTSLANVDIDVQYYVHHVSPPRKDWLRYCLKC